MTTIDHPNQQIYTKKGFVTQLTTYDRVSTSPAKNKCSFSPSKRMPKVKITGTDLFYALPSTKSTRAAGFGIGERFKSVSRNNSPSPDRYDVPSLFNPDNSTSTFAVHCKTRTFAFGTGREAYKVVTN